MEKIIYDIKQIDLLDDEIQTSLDTVKGEDTILKSNIDDIQEDCAYASAKPVINDIQEDCAYASAKSTGDAIENNDNSSETDESKEQCYICIDDLDDKYIKLKNCNHSFCYDCLNDWCSHLHKNKSKGSYNNYENNKFTKIKIKLECPTCKVQSSIYRNMKRNITCPVVKASSLKLTIGKTLVSSVSSIPILIDNKICGAPIRSIKYPNKKFCTYKGKAEYNWRCGHHKHIKY